MHGCVSDQEHRELRKHEVKKMLQSATNRIQMVLKKRFLTISEALLQNTKIVT